MSNWKHDFVTFSRTNRSKCVISLNSHRQMKITDITTFSKTNQSKRVISLNRHQQLKLKTDGLTKLEMTSSHQRQIKS